MPSQQDTVENLLALLTSVVAGTWNGADATALESALRNQSALAKLTLPAQNIEGMSLNTCKRAACERLAGGFAQLDEARKAALSAFETRMTSRDGSSPRTKRGMVKAIASLKSQQSLLEQDLASVTDAFRFTLSCAKRYAKESGRPDTMQRFRTDLREALARASMVKTLPFVVEGGASDDAAP